MKPKIIQNNSRVYAIVIKKNFKKKDSIEFFTDNSFSQQLGYMNRGKDYIIKPHFHKINFRKIKYTQEVLYIKSGKLKVFFYDPTSKINFANVILEKGDFILLCYGAHGFKMLKRTEIIEIKQGPYSEDDKTFLFD